MVTDVEVDEAIQLWNKIAVELGRTNVRTTRNKKMRSEATKFLYWAKERHINWRRYLTGSADYYRRKKVPYPAFAFLRRKSHELREHIERHGVRVEADRSLPVITTVERRIRPAREKFKSYYADGRQEICARHPQDNGGGYHRDSKWCRACPVTSSCIAYSRQ